MGRCAAARGRKRRDRCKKPPNFAKKQRKTRGNLEKHIGSSKGYMCARDEGRGTRPCKRPRSLAGGRSDEYAAKRTWAGRRSSETQAPDWNDASATAALAELRRGGAARKEAVERHAARVLASDGETTRFIARAGARLSAGDRETLATVW